MTYIDSMIAVVPTANSGKAITFRTLKQRGRTRY